MTPPLTWLVITTVADTNGREVALFGRAVFECPADTIVVTTPNGGREATHVGGLNAYLLAKSLVRELFRKEQDQARNNS